MPLGLPIHPQSVSVWSRYFGFQHLLGQSLAGHYLAEYTLGQISASVGHGVPIF